MLRSTTLLVLVFGAVHFVFAQGAMTLEDSNLQNYLSEQKTPIIQGKLLNYSPAEMPDVLITYQLAVPSFDKVFEETIKPKSDGSFKIELKHAFPYQEVLLQINKVGQLRLLINEGLTFGIDLSTISTSSKFIEGNGVEFSGPDAKVCDFVNRYENYKLDKKQDLIDEKLGILLNSEMSKAEKSKEIRKIYKRLAAIEAAYAKKNDRSMQDLLSNDRIASMYADLLWIHWGSKMKDLEFNEAVAFKPYLMTSASIRYYEFLGEYLRKPNRLEVKLYTERTLKEVVQEKAGSHDLDKFLREFNKKTDHLPFDEEIYRAGAYQYLKEHEQSILRSNIELQVRKMQKLSPMKSQFVYLISQPMSLDARKLYFEIIKSSLEPWSEKMVSQSIQQEEDRLEVLNESISTSSPFNHLNSEYIPQNDGIISSTKTVSALIHEIRSTKSDTLLILNLWVPWNSKCKYDLEVNDSWSTALDTLPIKLFFLCPEEMASREEWINESVDFPLEGQHVYLNKELFKDYYKTFKIRHYPHYVLIDQEGRIDPYYIESLGEMDPKLLEDKILTFNGI